MLDGNNLSILEDKQLLLSDFFKSSLIEEHNEKMKEF